MALMRQRGRKSKDKLAMLSLVRDQPFDNPTPTPEDFPPPPEHLSASSKAFWQDLVREHNFDELQLGLLKILCTALDRAQQAAEVLREQGLTYVGRRGGTHIRPEYAVERASRSFALTALSQLMRSK
jgi:phage terminase small subunit